MTRRKQQLREAFIFLIAVIATFFSFLLVIQWGPGCRRLHNVLLACVSSTRAPADMCAGHSGGNGTQNHLIASFRLPRCWERRENGNPLTHGIRNRVRFMESCALRLRSVDNERGHSPRYLQKPRSVMALMIWNGQSEKRQPASVLSCPVLN